MAWKRMTAGEYMENNSHRTGGLEISYAEMVEKLGAPHKNGEPDFPDDDHKIDVCWGFQKENGETVLIWNYKNGPAYNGAEVSLDDINHFSVFYITLEAWEDFRINFKVGAQPSVATV